MTTKHDVNDNDDDNDDDDDDDESGDANDDSEEEIFWRRRIWRKTFPQNNTGTGERKQRGKTRRKRNYKGK